MRLSDVVSDRSVADLAGSLRRYGYTGPDDVSKVVAWLDGQDEDINVEVSLPRARNHIERPDQRAFREVLIKAYGGRCALSGCPVPEALEAAHVDDWRSANDAGAGILLRADLHNLMDAGLLVINDAYTVTSVPPTYEAFKGRKLTLPKNRLHWPRVGRK